MARTIKQIKKSMTDEFMASADIREKYGLSQSDTFDAAFSTVSFESILFGIIATAVYALEALFDLFRADVDKKISSAVLSSIPWYHKICLEYQHGDALVLDEKTMQFIYPTDSPEKQQVKFAACRDKGGYVYILVAKDDGTGRPAMLSEDVLMPFKEYINCRKPAGVPTEIYSYDPDVIEVSLTVQYDPLVISADGSLISNPTIFPVETAVTEYLHRVEYGGALNKTRLVDAVQNVAGVKDVILNQVRSRAATGKSLDVVNTNNYESVGGAFQPENLRNTISYVLQI